MKQAKTRQDRTGPFTYICMKVLCLVYLKFSYGKMQEIKEWRRSNLNIQ